MYEAPPVFTPELTLDKEDLGSDVAMVRTGAACRREPRVHEDSLRRIATGAAGKEAHDRRDQRS